MSDREMRCTRERQKRESACVGGEGRDRVRERQVELEVAKLQVRLLK